MSEQHKTLGTLRSLRHFRNVFLAGVLVAVPLAVTYLVFRWLFDALDGIFQPIVRIVFGHDLPGVGLVGLVVLVYLLGIIATNFIGRQVIRGMDSVLSRTPMVQYVYKSAREVVDAVRNLRKVPFKQVVIVEFPKVGMHSLAFVTGKPIIVGDEEKIPLFVPHTPNPMTGFLVLLPAEDIIDTNLSVDEAMRMVLSGGLLSPDKIALAGREKPGAQEEPAPGPGPAA